MTPDTPGRVGVVGAADARDPLVHRLEAADIAVETADVPSDALAAAVAAMAARCAVVVTSLANEASLRAALADCGAASARDLVVLDVSPIAPATQRAMAAAASASGVTLVGGRIVTRFRDGVPRLTLYVDEDATQSAALRGVLAALGNDAVTTGAAGRAKALGLVDDLLAGVNAAVVGEAMALGRSASLDTPTLIALLQKGSGATSMMAHADVAARDRAVFARALAQVAAAAQQVDHSLLFGSVAIGLLLGQSHAEPLAGPPRRVGDDVRQERHAAA